MNTEKHISSRRTDIPDSSKKEKQSDIQRIIGQILRFSKEFDFTAITTVRIEETSETEGVWRLEELGRMREYNKNEDICNIFDDNTAQEIISIFQRSKRLQQLLKRNVVINGVEISSRMTPPFMKVRDSRSDTGGLFAEYVKEALVKKGQGDRSAVLFANTEWENDLKKQDNTNTDDENKIILRHEDESRTKIFGLLGITKSVQKRLADLGLEIYKETDDNNIRYYLMQKNKKQ